jgi:L-ascorbate metabolism protein UlaG (beta-lactamase superfamily)
LMPWGMSDLAHDLGFERVIELEWWESFSRANWKVTLTPCRHWGARMLRDDHRGYGGFVVPMHYGTFKLSFEHLDEPPRWLKELADRDGVSNRLRILDEGTPHGF